MKIIICTLRRSGSTVFWKAFREHTDFTCYDEPFNPGLSVLPKEHQKQVYGEYIDLIAKDAETFWEAYVPIVPVEENKSQLSAAQKNYLKFLLESDEHVVIDTTRCWNKLESLKEVLEPYPHVFIHLYRDPIAFSSSHLLPSEIKSWWLNRTLKKEFWTRTDGFNYWKMEEVLGNLPKSAFDGLVLQKLKLNGTAQEFYEAPAHVKLRFFSNIANAIMDSEGQKLFTKQFLSVDFESFCKNPDLFFNLLSERIKIKFKEANFSHIKPAAKGYMVEDSRWNCEYSKIIPKWQNNN